MSQDKSRVRAEFREEMQEFKRRRIIEEALRLFYERGYDGTSVDALAATIGVTKPEAFMAGDRGFRKGTTTRSVPSKPT